MKVSVHLISAPFSRPQSPSIQIGALKAYLEKQAPHLKVHAYSAFLKIPFLADRCEAGDASSAGLASYRRLSPYGEYPYMMAYFRDFERWRLKRARSPLRSLLAQINAAHMEDNETLLMAPLREEDVSRVSEATRRYVDEELVPKLSKRAVNIVGFTLNYDQVYASCYMTRHLIERHPNYRYCFVFGGMSAALPDVVRVLQHLRLPVLSVLGEGEIKLLNIIRSIESIADKNASIERVLDRASKSDPGVFHVDRPPDLFGGKERREYESQLRSMDELPLPDCAEFFATLRHISISHENYISNRASVVTLAEGTRGCFAKCEFCGLNYLWEGFRKLSADEIYERFSRTVTQYGIEEVHFVDNVADTWAEEFSEIILKRGVQVKFFLELRAHHPEIFWAKLALAGMNQVQVGVEAISAHLLEAGIRKGTRVYQNIRVQKLLKELRIFSSSNLITYHPGSTVEDVEETKRLLELIPHLQPFLLSPFVLSIGSPLYARLTDAEKRRLRPQNRVRFPGSLRKYQIGSGFAVPKSLRLGNEVVSAWSKFSRWYQRHTDELSKHKPELRVRRFPDGRFKIIDTRFQKSREYILEGDSARVYELCHQAPTLKKMVEQTGLPERRILGLLQPLLDAKIMYFIDNRYLSLALRPREEVLRSAYRFNSAQ